MKVYDSGWSQPHVKVTLTPTLTPITTPRPIVSQPAGQSARPSTSETQATPAGFPSYGGYDSADGAAHTSYADRFGASECRASRVYPVQRDMARLAAACANPQAWGRAREARQPTTFGIVSTNPDFLFH